MPRIKIKFDEDSESLVNELVKAVKGLQDGLEARIEVIEARLTQLEPPPAHEEQHGEDQAEADG